MVTVMSWSARSASACWLAETHGHDPASVDEALPLLPVTKVVIGICSRGDTTQNSSPSAPSQRSPIGDGIVASSVLQQMLNRQWD